MEQQPLEGVTRGQNQLHVVPEDFNAAAAVVLPLLERIDDAVAATQLLIVTSDEEGAAAIAEGVAAGIADGIRVLGATERRRAARVLRGAPAHVVVAPAATVVALMEGAALKLDALRAVVLAWVDGAAGGPLETIMADVPKEAARFILVSEVTEEAEQLVERYARRARRVQSALAELAPVSLSYVTTTAAGRTGALRRTLDALDPESAVVITRDESSRVQVAAAMRALGYGAEGSLMRVIVAGTEPGSAALGVLFDLPGSTAELRSVVSTLAPARVVALVAPRQIAALRAMAGGTASPLALPDAAARARAREESLRDELRAVLEAGGYARELLALEPLLADHDGAEVAAAALKLLELQRARPTTASASAAQGPLTRLYLNVGSMDDVRPGDLVGAITNEAGISRTDLGRVEVRDRHSTVEVATPVADMVVSKITGVTIKTRRVIARIDEDRPRERKPRGDDRGGGRGRPDRGDRRGPPRERRPSRERPPRGR